MAIALTDLEKAAPSERLAKNLEYFKNRAEDNSKLDECQEACVGSSVAHSGFCIETALMLLNGMMQYAERSQLSTLHSIKGYLSAAVAEVKDATFVLDGYHAWYKQNVAWEEEVSEDLDTCGYAGKWKSAKEGVTRDKPDLSGSAYWDAVRAYFLELGGCCLSERCEPASTDAAPQRALPIIPRMPHYEPQKVREG